MKSFAHVFNPSNFGNPDTILNTKSFEQDSILSNFGEHIIAQIEEIPRDYFNPSHFGICKLAQNEEIPRISSF